MTSKKTKMMRAAAKAPRWVRDIAAAKFDPTGARVHKAQKLGKFGAASEVRPGNILAHELQLCGLKRMAGEADKGSYAADEPKLLGDLQFALGLKSLTMDEVGKIGRLYRRVLDGEFRTSTT